MTDAPRPALPRLAALGIVAGVLGASAWLGRRNAPAGDHPAIRRWYRRLDKPGFTPPDAVFGAVWPVLETGMAIGGYRVLRQPAGPTRTGAVALWLGTSAMIGGWTEIFFRRHALAGSTAAAGAMLVTSAGFAATAAKIDRPAAATAVPLVAWLGFATVLSERIREANDG
ncbi:TspO/MBR family protein [Sphingomonas sp. CV7422]|uniref:TspO/MBR family protein n=1 Tax=Sphingomonas sp. CV7422 TaxID=3018036 RepID=UPI0022FDB22D|nr:TspO/MBR family protein [Sphingomonas sp. CV7422]